MTAFFSTATEHAMNTDQITGAAKAQQEAGEARKVVQGG